MEIRNLELEESKGLSRELMKMARKSKAKKKLMALAAGIVLACLTITAVWFMGKTQGKNKSIAEIEELNRTIHLLEEEIQKMKEEPLIIYPVAPKIELKVLENKISEIAELATIEYLFTNSAVFTDSKQIQKWNLNIPFTEKSFIIQWSGVIKAGVNLDKVSVTVNEEELKIVVSVPKAQILSYEIDNDSMKVLDEKNNIFNPIRVEDKIKVDSKTEEEMKTRAIESGLLEKAQINAENVLARLLLSDPDIAAFYAVEFEIIPE